MPDNTSRFTDNPFRQPGLSREQLVWLAKRDEAMKIYRESGDSTMAQEIGLFPKEGVKEANDMVEKARRMVGNADAGNA